MRLERCLRDVELQRCLCKLACTQKVRTGKMAEY